MDSLDGESGEKFLVLEFQRSLEVAADCEQLSLRLRKILSEYSDEVTLFTMTSMVVVRLKNSYNLDKEGIEHFFKSLTSIALINDSYIR